MAGYIGELNKGLNANGVSVLLHTVNASGESAIIFSITPRFKIYRFEFINMHPSAADSVFEFQVNAIGQTGFNETGTTTHFSASHKEDASASAVGYNVGSDLAQAADEHQLAYGIGGENYESGSGYLLLYNPSSGTYTKNFIGRMQYNYTDSYSADSHSAGYFNVDAALIEVEFSFAGETIDDGIIKMYGVETTLGVPV